MLRLFLWLISSQCNEISQRRIFIFSSGEVGGGLLHNLVSRWSVLHLTVELNLMWLLWIYVELSINPYLFEGFQVINIFQCADSQAYLSKADSYTKSAF